LCVKASSIMATAVGCETLESVSGVLSGSRKAASA
jgi:hypothetical protein